MDTEEYINSGILYDYCTDNLSPAERLEVEGMCTRYPEVKAELQQLQAALEKYAEGGAKTPAPGIKDNIWNALENINKERAGDLNDLPLINKYSDYHNWKKMVLPLMPQNMPAGMVRIPLRHTSSISQILVITRNDVQDETHEREKESFLVLEGECECRLGNELVHLTPGDFLEIPLYTSHTVKLLTPYVVAVVQHVAV